MHSLEEADMQVMHMPAGRMDLFCVLEHWPVAADQLTGISSLATACGLF